TSAPTNVAPLWVRSLATWASTNISPRWGADPRHWASSNISPRWGAEPRHLGFYKYCTPLGCGASPPRLLQIFHPSGVRSLGTSGSYKYATPLGCGASAPPAPTNMPPRWGEHDVTMNLDMKSICTIILTLIFVVPLSP